jgi:hypothetical protein
MCLPVNTRSRICGRAATWHFFDFVQPAERMHSCLGGRGRPRSLSALCGHPTHEWINRLGVDAVGVMPVPTRLHLGRNPVNVPGQGRRLQTLDAETGLGRTQPLSGCSSPSASCAGGLDLEFSVPKPGTRNLLIAPWLGWPRRAHPMFAGIATSKPSRSPACCNARPLRAGLRCLRQTP